MGYWKMKRQAPCKNSLSIGLMIHEHTHSGSFKGSHNLYKCSACNFRSSDIDAAVYFKICRVQDLRTDDLFLVERLEARL